MVKKLYKFRTEKYVELLDGHTVEWLSKQTGYTNMSLYALFNGRRRCKRALAVAICSILGKENIDDYFILIDEGE